MAKSVSMYFFVLFVIRGQIAVVLCTYDLTLANIIYIVRDTFRSLGGRDVAGRYSAFKRRNGSPRD